MRTFLSIVNNSAFNIQRILVYSWAGALWSVTPALDLTIANYAYNQKSNAANGCRDASAATCAGELQDASVVGDYHFSKRFDGYAGVNHSLAQNGLASGFLFKNDWTPMVDIRFNF